MAGLSLQHTEYWGERRQDVDEYVPWPSFGKPQLLAYMPGPPMPSMDRNMRLYSWNFGRVTRYYWDGNNWQTPVVLGR